MQAPSRRLDPSRSPVREQSPPRANPARSHGFSARSPAEGSCRSGCRRQRTPIRRDLPRHSAPGFPPAPAATTIPILAPKARRTAISSSPDRAHQEKTGQIRACDQQNRRDSDQQRAHQGTGLHHGVFMQECHLRLNAQAPHKSWVVSHRLFSDKLGISLCLCRCNARFESAHHAKVPRCRVARSELFQAKAQRGGTQSSLLFKCPGTRGNSKSRGMMPITR